MDEYRLIFEKLLFEFNWGQEDPKNTISDPDSPPLVLQQIANSGRLEDPVIKNANTKIAKSEKINEKVP